MKRVPCEVWSRPVGYFSPKHRWNAGKQAEFGDRRAFSIEVSLASTAPEHRAEREMRERLVLEGVLRA